MGAAAEGVPAEVGEGAGNLRIRKPPLPSASPPLSYGVVTPVVRAMKYVAPSAGAMIPVWAPVQRDRVLLKM